MEMTNFTITRRDASGEAFSLDKIMNAIIKAFNSVNQPVNLGRVSKVLCNLDIHDGVTVDDIQNQTEVALMKEGYYTVAKSFMLNRKHNTEEHHRLNLLKRIIEHDKSVSGNILGGSFQVDAKNINLEIPDENDHYRTWEYGEPTHSSDTYVNTDELANRVFGMFIGSMPFDLKARINKRIASLSTIQKVKNDIEVAVNKAADADDVKVLKEELNNIRIDKRIYNGATSVDISDEFMMQMAKLYNVLTGKYIDQKNTEELKDFILAVTAVVDKARKGLTRAVSAISRKIKEWYGYVHGLGERMMQRMLHLLKNREKATQMECDRLAIIDDWVTRINEVIEKNPSLALVA